MRRHFCFADLALAGVWDHSTFREDMMGRLRRTSQFIAVTTFGNTADATTLIDRVKRIHLQITGVDAMGTPYAASDGYTWRKPAAFSPLTDVIKIHSSALLNREFYAGPAEFSGL